jgi:putative transcriptional regulator
MSTDPDDFDQLIATLGGVLALTDDGQSLGDGLMIPDALDVAAVRKKTGLSQAALPAALGCR